MYVLLDSVSGQNTNLSNVASIFYWSNFFSKVPFIIQNSHVVGFVTGVLHPTASSPV